MGLPINILQSLISVQRNKLAYLNKARASGKRWRSYFSSIGFQREENAMHESYKRSCVDICKAEAVQRALKRELRDTIAADKHARQFAAACKHISDVVADAKARAGEEY